MKIFGRISLYLSLIFVTAGVAMDCHGNMLSSYFLNSLIDFPESGKERNLHVEREDSLPEVFVRSQRLPDEVIKGQKLEGEELQGLSAHSVADAMRYFSGIQVKDYGGVGGIKTIDVRGMGSSHTGVFYDGVQITNAQNGQVDLGRYSLDNLEEISMYNGQKSSVFQPAKDFSSGTAVYLRTRRPVFSAGKKYNLEMAFRTGSFGLANPLARFEWKISDRVSLLTSVEYMFATGRYKFRYRKMFSDGTVAWDTTAVRHNGDISAFRAEANLFGQFERGNWMAKAYYYDSSRGIPGAIVNNVWKNSQHQWDRNFFLQGSAQKASENERYEWMVNGKYARDYMRYLNPDTTLMYIDNSFYQDEIYLSTSHRYRILQEWEMAASIDWQWDKLDSDMSRFVNPRRNTLLGAVATSWHKNGLKAQASLLLTEVWDKTLSGNGNFHKLTPSLFLSWSPLKRQQWTIHGFYKKIFRMPTFNDLYYTDIGNSSLKPEYASQYSIGTEGTFTGLVSWMESLGGSCDVYYNRVTDKIIAVPKGTGQYRWMMMNIGEARITGVDVTLNARFLLPGHVTLGGRLTYSYERARDFSDPSDNLDAGGTYKGQIAYIPLNSGSATLQAEWQRLGFNYSFIYVGERWDNSSNIRANYVQPWYTHDLSVRYGFNIIKRIDMTAQLEVNNIFNQQYEVIRNYPMPGRNFRLTLRVMI